MNKVNERFVNYTFNLAVSDKENNTTKKHSYHAAIMVKNGKIIGEGINNTAEMKLLGNFNEKPIFTHAEMEAIKNYLKKNTKKRLKYESNLPYVRRSFQHYYNSSSILSGKQSEKQSRKRRLYKLQIVK